jgi:hypothetical protein
MAFWVVSHCNTTNKREDYVRALQKYIKVDVFGACSTTSKKLCNTRRAAFYSLKSHKCFKEYSKEYMFYLAFENSNCKGYITEKFYRTIKHPIVPVVMGGDTYSIHSRPPPSSYIDVNNFKTVKDLADYLTMLSKNESAYMEYFNWKKDYMSYTW